MKHDQYFQSFHFETERAIYLVKKYKEPFVRTLKKPIRRIDALSFEAKKATVQEISQEIISNRYEAKSERKITPDHKQDLLKLSSDVLLSTTIVDAVFLEELVDKYISLNQKILANRSYRSISHITSDKDTFNNLFFSPMIIIADSEHLAASEKLNRHTSAKSLISIFIGIKLFLSNYRRFFKL